MPKEATMRCFIAIELPPVILQHVELLQGELKSYDLKLRWVQPRNIHLTIKFLGDITAVQKEKVIAVLKQTADQTMPFDLVMQGMGFFPGSRNARILWAGVGGRTDLLMQIHQTMEKYLINDGFEKEKKPYKAHLTLARIKGRMDSGKLQGAVRHVENYDPVRFPVSALTLYKSELRPQGAIYTALNRLDLCGRYEV